MVWFLTQMPLYGLMAVVNIQISVQGWKRAATDFSNQSYLTNAMIAILSILFRVSRLWSSAGKAWGSHPVTRKLLKMWQWNLEDWQRVRENLSFDVSKPADSDITIFMKYKKIHTNGSQIVKTDEES